MLYQIAIFSSSEFTESQRERLFFTDHPASPGKVIDLNLCRFLIRGLPPSFLKNRSYALWMRFNSCRLRNRYRRRSCAVTSWKYSNAADSQAQIPMHRCVHCFQAGIYRFSWIIKYQVFNPFQVRQTHNLAITLEMSANLIRILYHILIECQIFLGKVYFLRAYIPS